ncbi:MAG: 2-hydroxyacid dehydrogenase [Candidatus Altiarchaeota archaeon]
MLGKKRRPKLARELVSELLSKQIGQDIVGDRELSDHILYTKASGGVVAKAFSTYRLPTVGEVDSPEVRFLREHVSVAEYSHPTPLDGRQLTRLIREHDGGLDGIFCFLEPVDRGVLDAAAQKGVKWIASSGTGHDNKDKEYAAKKGIQLTNAPGALMHTVSEAAVTHALNIVLNMPKWIDETYRGCQTGCSMERGRHEKLQGKTVTVVGLGQVGFEIARRMIPFLPDKDGRGRLLYVDAQPALKYEKEKVLQEILDSTYKALKIAHPKDEIKRPKPVEGVSLREALRRADVIILAPPLVRDGKYKTEGMVGKKELSLVKETAYLVNIARGQIVDERAVADALATGKIAGYATDVLVDEWKRPDHLYKAAKKGGTVVYVSEHVASNDRETRMMAMTGIMLRNAIACIRGEEPPNPINELVKR